MGLTLCVPCNKHFSTASNLKAHMNLMHPEMKVSNVKDNRFWNILLIQFTGAYYLSLLIENRNKTLPHHWGKVKLTLEFPCESCEKAFQTKKNLFEPCKYAYYIHVKIHKGKPFSPFCNKHLSTVSYLKAHMAQKYPGFVWTSPNFRKHPEPFLAKQTSIFLWYLPQIFLQQKIASKSFGHPQRQNHVSNM